MRKLKALIEDLAVTMLDPPWDQFARLLRLVDRVVDSAELDDLTAEELRRLKSFRITLHRSAKMTPEAMLLHVAAEWAGAAAQAVQKLSIGAEATDAVQQMMLAGDIAQAADTPFGNVT